MKSLLIVALFFVLLLDPTISGADTPTTQPAGPLGFVVQDISGANYDLSQLKGKVVLIVNTASKCGLTPQYKGLEALFEKYKDQGLIIVGFPANNFKEQEPGSNEQIAEFCQQNYGVTFPMMGKISVKGADKHPLYKYLTEAPTAGSFVGEIGWNFTKFLVGRDGTVVNRFDSKIKPEDQNVVSAIESALASK